MRSYHHRGARTRPQYICWAIDAESDPERARVAATGARSLPGRLPGTRGARRRRRAGRGWRRNRRGRLRLRGRRDRRGDARRDLGSGVALPPVGAGTGVARQGAEVGTAVGAAPAGLATGAEARRPLPAAVGATVPAVAVTAPLGVPLAASAVGWLGPVLAELAGADAAEPEPDADAEHPARARPAAIPSVQPAAARADLLCDRTCMLLEVVPVKTRTPGNTPGRGESCARRAATFLPVRPYMDKRGRSGARRRPVAVRPGDGGRPRSARPGRPAERTE